MTATLAEALESLAEHPHDVAGAQEDIRAAAALIRELVEREAALREALEKIANHATGGVGGNPQGFVQFARAVLEAK